MGYLNQKKSQGRMRLILNTAVVVFGLLVFALLFGNDKSDFSFTVNLWALHIYVGLVIFTALALLFRRWIYATIFAVFLIFNYFIIGATVNIFNNVKIIDGFDFDLTYLKNTNDSEAMFNGDVERFGLIKLSPKTKANYQITRQNNEDLMIIDVNFSKMKPENRHIVFDNLAEFVLKQNIPVILLGDFGIPAWSETFHNFLEKTELKVKNSIILCDGETRYNIFNYPSINLLAYKNVGINQIKIHKKPDSIYYPFSFILNIS